MLPPHLSNATDEREWRVGYKRGGEKKEWERERERIKMNATKEGGEIRGVRARYHHRYSTNPKITKMTLVKHVSKLNCIQKSLKQLLLFCF